MVALERLLNLYQGRFLPTCYEDWAEVLRTRLDRDFVATVLATARQALEQSDFDILSTAVGRLLELDPLNEEAVILLMEGELKAARPEQAVAVYEQLCRSLKAEGLEPDTEVMKLYYRASLGI
jgi:DNA-binding SARP family transcriptional activator